jgi:molybdopterin/thiamine biosynthesis adenylyltransferase
LQGLDDFRNRLIGEGSAITTIVDEIVRDEDKNLGCRRTEIQILEGEVEGIEGSLRVIIPKTGPVIGKRRG